MSRGRNEELTTTSYAILGLLALRPWTTYELAKQMERTLNRMWPRARSKLYEEPKKLQAHGLATASRQHVGRRPRTVYAITAKGRRALTKWLQTPGQGPSLEFEQLIQLFFADQGTKQDAARTIRAAAEWARAQSADFADGARPYLTGQGPFPERMATNVIGARFTVDFYDLVHRWSQWAAEVVERWPDDPSAAEPDWALVADIVRRADAVADASHGDSGDVTRSGR